MRFMGGVSPQSHAGAFETLEPMRGFANRNNLGSGGKIRSKKIVTDQALGKNLPSLGSAKPLEFVIQLHVKETQSEANDCGQEDR
jgi:hypothetical protein